MFNILKKAVFKEEPKVLLIDISEIAPNPSQARQRYDSLALAELAKSIEEFGVIQPITVRETDEGYEIISGERRLRASIMAGLSKIPCLVIEADEKKSAALSLLENLQREDLSFFEVAEGYKNLMKEQGLTRDELAKKIGKSKSSVSNKLRLLQMPPRARRLIHDYSISERHARCLLALPDERSQTYIIQQIYHNKLNVKETEKLVEEYLKTGKKETSEIKIKKDSLSFLETIRKSVESMKNKGIDASIQKVDRDWGTEYVIEIKQPQEK